MVLADNAIGREVVVAEVDDKEAAIVHVRQEARHHVDVVAVSGMTPKHLYIYIYEYQD